MLLPSRELIHATLFEAGELNQIECLIDSVAGCNLVASSATTRAQTEGDVLENVQVGKQRVILKHHAEAAMFRRKVCDLTTVELNAASVRSFQSRDYSQRGRLSASRWTKQAKELAALDSDGNVIDRRRRPKAF